MVTWDRNDKRSGPAALEGPMTSCVHVLILSEDASLHLGVPESTGVAGKTGSMKWPISYNSFIRPLPSCSRKYQFLGNVWQQAGVFLNAP